MNLVAHESGLTKKEASRILGVSLDQFTAWELGHDPIPRVVLYGLQAMLNEGLSYGEGIPMLRPVNGRFRYSWTLKSFNVLIPDNEGAVMLKHSIRRAAASKGLEVRVQLHMQEYFHVEVL